MLRMRRMLFRALAAGTQQQIRCMETRMDWRSYGVGGNKKPAPKKDLQKPEKPGYPGKVSGDCCWTAMPRRLNPIRFFASKANSSTNQGFTGFSPLDQTHYKPSDNLNRTFQRTWSECQLLHPKSRPITYEGRNRPESKTEENPGKCPKGDMNLGLGQCHRKDSSPCPRVKSPYCKDESMTGCFPVTHPSGCARLRTTYPSYSEWVKDALTDLPPKKCSEWVKNALTDLAPNNCLS